MNAAVLLRTILSHHAALRRGEPGARTARLAMSRVGRWRVAWPGDRRRINALLARGRSPLGVVGRRRRAMAVTCYNYW